jgi:hypothetical protein
MKKILLFFIAVFMLFISPVNASKYEDNYNNEYIQYNLASSSKNDDEDSNFVFWGMLIVAFVAISIFLIAYKSDDDL